MKTYRYELMPLPEQSQNSFYGKAVVEINADCSETLYSYGTPVIKRYDDGKLVRLINKPTSTTLKHAKAFCGISKKQFIELPLE